MNCPSMIRIIEGKRYRTETATLLADDVYWDGHNMERGGRNTFLFRTPRGAYFTVTVTMWQGEHDTLTPLDEAEAIRLYEGALREHYVAYSEAFPNVTVEEA